MNEIHPQMKSGNLSLAISDHLPSFFYVPKDNQNHLPKKHNTYTRSTKNFNRENFISEFKDIHWNTILRPDENNTNLSMERFMTRFGELLDKHMPLRKMTNKEYKRRFKPWISDQILTKINTKNKLYQRMMRSKNPEAKSRLNDEYKTMKNEITNATRQSKKDYYKQYFTENASGEVIIGLLLPPISLCILPPRIPSRDNTSLDNTSPLII